MTKHAWKVMRIVGGFLLIPVGIILSIPGVPGPGLALVILGLVILSDHFAWARRLVEWGKVKLEGLPVVGEKLKARNAKANNS